MEQYKLPCLNKKLFGIDCPGCGMQRSIALPIKSVFSEAFFMYPAIYRLLFLAFNLFVKYQYSNKWTINQIGITILTTMVLCYTTKSNYF
ncbi:uncharacterized protein DUF2752 [Aquimarina brevivitae]|uniref:Uncharacterized protein DUF2752 n=1 Tax=Aquimarina brevivitae TaxID=323412 RepID=A0A4Q7NU42_9FLAO|nr:uncharacterized protein DUF2752 [Aquimarina brevivitae]